MVGYLLIPMELYGFEAIFPFNKTGRDKFGKQVYNYTGSLEDIECSSNFCLLSVIAVNLNSRFRHKSLHHHFSKMTWG